MCPTSIEQWEARCKQLEHDYASLQTRCASLEAANADLSARLQATEACAANDLLWQQTLERSPLTLGSTKVNVSPIAQLFAPPFDIREMEAPKCPQPPPPQLARPSDIPCHDGAASSRDACDQQQQQQQCGSSQQAHSQLPPLPPPQQQRSRRISKAPSSLANAAAPVPSTLFCVTKAALTAFSDQRRFAIGMGLYERVVEGRPSTHTPLTGGFEVGPLVFCNDRLLRLHDDDEEVARWRVMTCIDSSAAFCRALQGLLKNVLRGDVNPVAVRRLYKLHVCPSTMAVTYLYPCSYHDGEVLHELAYLMVPVPQTIEKGLTENLMQDHIALKYAPAMMTTVDRWGRIVAQNSASFGALGFHGRDHRRLGHEQQRVHYLQELFATDVEAYETMLTMTSHSLGSTFKIVLQITSPTLLAWLGKQGEEVWHEIQVSTMPHPVYSELLFIASQTDVTPTIIVQRQLEQMQQMQKELLSEILPPQVSDKLLLTAENSGDDGGKDAFMTPEGHHLLQLLTARRSGVGEQLSQPSTPNAQDNNSSSNVNNNNNNNNSNDNSNSSTANGLGRTGSGSSSEAYAHALDYFDGDVAIRLTRRDVMSLATYHEEVTILFTDIVGFSAMSQQLHPSEIMLLLNNVYSVYDGLCEIYDVYKVETIGDSFMAAGGLFEGTSSRKHLGGRDPLHAVKVLSFARALVAATAFMRTPLGEPLNIRIGIHSGPCMSGVVGRKMPRFCLFGDSINMASRMESTGQAGMIHASQVTRDLLPHEPWAPTGGVYAKGMGTVQSYIWAGERMLTPTPPVSIAVRQQQNAADKAAAADSTTASAHRRYSLDARHTSATAAGAAGAAAAALSSQPPGCLLQSQVVPQRDGPEGRRPGPFTLSGSQLIL